MQQIDLAELPPALAEHVSPRARLTFPPQGKTSEVAFAAADGRLVVVKRCAHRIYLDWLRREHVALRALAESALPIPRFIAFAEADAGGQPVGWLVMSRLSGSPLLGALIEASKPQRTVLFRRLGEIVRRLHVTRVPPALARDGAWLPRQIKRARANLPWCDGTAAGSAIRATTSHSRCRRNRSSSSRPKRSTHSSRRTALRRSTNLRATGSCVSTTTSDRRGSRFSRRRTTVPPCLTNFSPISFSRRT